METQSRRQMITDTFRYAALSVIGFFAGSAIIKRHRLINEGKCLNRGICGGCKLYKDCRLPSALSKKQFFIEKNNGNRKN